MGKIIRNGIEFSGTRDTANNINYDGTLSGLNANTVQEAVDELNENVNELNSSLDTLNNSLGGVQFGVDINGNRGYYDANGEFVNFSDGDGGFIVGITDITNLKDSGKGFVVNPNTVLTLGKEYDLSKYKYIQLIYQDYNYYNRTWGVGYTTTPNDSYTNCVATSNKTTASATGTRQSTFTTKTMYLDISDVNEKGYPFVYLTSDMYSYILKLQLVNELEEI